eukprot:TRINITY_DN14784_c0_g3_i1.p1 TRINITY_DN14784_c0_g3~~TRINITY_DN14784_c0_g3_i1.p1  ORF type:complete len:457 (+),score=65.00 TRINITY_DN14784_c0_g3_i1:90-1373(+)
MVRLVNPRPREALCPALFRRRNRRLTLRGSNSADEADATSFTTTSSVICFFVASTGIEAMNIFCDVLFLIGSFLFFPGVTLEQLDLGCNLFIIASLILALINGYDLIPDIVRACCAQPARGEESPQSGAASPTSTIAAGSVDGAVSFEDSGVFEKAMYLVGSIVFFVGTLYWEHPRLVVANNLVPADEAGDVLMWAIWLFIVGSVMFVFAAFCNALSLSQTQLTFTKWAIATCSTYEFGGICFTIGSVAFMPNQGCGEDMERLGAWCFVAGSLCYLGGALVDLLKAIALARLALHEREAALAVSRVWRRHVTLRREQRLAAESATPSALVDSETLATTDANAYTRLEVEVEHGVSPREEAESLPLASPPSAEPLELSLPMPEEQAAITGEGAAATPKANPSSRMRVPFLSRALRFRNSSGETTAPAA